jgi:lipopolysaccharide transport system ATP-binding protein
MKPIIEIKGLGKRYDITHQRGGYIALRDVFANVFKHPFSFVTSKAKKVVGLEKKEAFWALKDISFDVMPGEVVGIIGKNGAGKSTLLKILTGITPPTEGEAVMRGRVSSLLEVGTGFHPELTGRENVLLNGAILGMTRKEIAQKFDAIVAFSGVEKFLDTPVKYYSSGMQVRLAFSVAAHMEPDILIVDEVLAVGDAEFQKKCMGKMEEVTKKDGRTILFVSHNLAAIASLCHTTVVLDNGKIVFHGPTREAIAFYQRRSVTTSSSTPVQLELDHGAVRFSDFTFNDIPSSQASQIASGAPLTIAVRVESNDPSGSLIISYGVRRRSDSVLAVYSHSALEGARLTAEPGTIEATFDMPRLAPGDYIVEFGAELNGKLGFGEQKEIGFFTIPETIAFKGGLTFKEFPSVVMADSTWKNRLL